MGTYFNPPERLPVVARRLRVNKAFPSYEEVVSELTSEETLFGLYHRCDVGYPGFDNAVHLYSREEFDTFEQQCRKGWIMRIGFYGMSVEAFRRHFGYEPSQER